MDSDTSVFAGEKVWPDSRNIAIREIEDRLLALVQSDKYKPFVEVKQ